MMAENDDDSYDNFDDDNNGNKPGNSAGHEPHSVSPLRVVGGTIAPWMVITVIFIGVVIIVMMVIVIILIIKVKIMTDHKSQDGHHRHLHRRGHHRHDGHRQHGATLSLLALGI